MQIRYYKEYSRYLDRFMEFKVYGHAGRPIIIFPCQSGRFYDWEDRNMCNLAAPWIDSGKLGQPRSRASAHRDAGALVQLYL